MRTIKFRLTREGKIVGYELHKPVNDVMTMFHSETGETWRVVLNRGADSIIHDHKDQFVATEGGVDLFENDKVEYMMEQGEGDFDDMHPPFKTTGTIKFTKSGRFLPFPHHDKCDGDHFYSYRFYDFKVIGREEIK